MQIFSVVFIQQFDQNVSIFIFVFSSYSCLIVKTMFQASVQY